MRKSSRKSSQGGLSVPDEKVEYANVMEVHQYLDDELGPRQDTLKFDGGRHQNVYSVQDFGQGHETRINQAHFQLEQRSKQRLPLTFIISS